MCACQFAHKCYEGDTPTPAVTQPADAHTRVPTAASSASVGTHVGGVHFDCDALSDQSHGQHEARVRPLADQSSRHASQRSAHDLDEVAFLDQRTRIESQAAFDQRADAFDFTLRNRRGPPFGYTIDDGGLTNKDALPVHLCIYDTCRTSN